MMTLNMKYNAVFIRAHYYYLNNLSLLWCGRSYNLSLTWDQPIANHPIKSPQTKSSPAHTCSCCHSDIREEMITTSASCRL